MSTTAHADASLIYGSSKSSAAIVTTPTTISTTYCASSISDTSIGHTSSKEPQATSISGTVNAAVTATGFAAIGTNGTPPGTGVNTGSIVGGTVGGIVLLTLVVIFCWTARRRRRLGKDKYDRMAEPFSQQGPRAVQAKGRTQIDMQAPVLNEPSAVARIRPATWTTSRPNGERGIHSDSDEGEGGQGGGRVGMQMETETVRRRLQMIYDGMRSGKLVYVDEAPPVYEENE